MQIFIDQSESLASINGIPAVDYWGLNSTLLLGYIFLLVFTLLFIFRRRLNHKYAGLFVIALFWLPLYANFTYNNIYDLWENADYWALDLGYKLQKRHCDIDRRNFYGNDFCRLPAFARFIKENIPPGHKVDIFSDYSTKVYLRYHIYPEHRLAEPADYLITAGGPYRYQSGVLYGWDRAKGEARALASGLEPVARFAPDWYILRQP
jgi:hypothetical protein